jgi:hypothetical protein
MNRVWKMALVAVLVASVSVAQDVVSFFKGTIKKVDSATKTIVVKTADGTEHTVKVTDQAVITGTKKGFEGLKDGTEVIVKSTGKGADETATEVGKLGEDGMKSTTGVITKFDKDTKTVVVKSANGSEKTFQLTSSAVADASKATASGMAKGTKVTVYYTEEAGKKTAHYISQ